MDRRSFLKSAAASTAVLRTLSADAAQPAASNPTACTQPASSARVDGHTLVCRFARDRESWTVYEDLRTRDGVLTFVSSAGMTRVLRKTAEATFADPGPQRLGLDIKDIGMAGPDLLADKLLAHGEPSEEEVRRATHEFVPPRHAEPQLSPHPEHHRRHPRVRRHHARVP